ncbi:DUF4132 domain-containing protein [Janthinobacterium sp. RB2R34]|uniref:DUF4132 domain-containing protein n=1 Tax=Janthinobacterium sp. RB2R34 TaxID=3424193 RepID=UPI003F23CE34
MNDTSKPAVDGELQAALELGLKGLSLSATSLWQRSCDFVLTGEHEIVLQELTHAGLRGATMLGHPGRLSHAFFAIGITDKEARQARAGLVARAQFYALLDADTLSPEMLVRLGKVLAAADQGQSFEPTGADVPDWLHYLVNDALFATCSETREDASSANRRAWNIRLLMRLLACEGLPEAAALELVFERRNIADYMMERCLQRLLVPNVIDNVMQEQPGDVRELAPRLSAQGKRLLAGRIGGAAELAHTFDDVLVALAVDSSKTVRAVAAPFVSAMAEERQLELLRHWLVNGKLDERTQAAELLGRTPSPARRALLEQALATEAGKAVKQAITNALARMGDVQTNEADETPPPAPEAPLTFLDEEAMVILLENHIALLKKCDEDAREEVEENRSRREQYDWEQQRREQQYAIDEPQLRAVIRAFNGEGDAASRALLKDHAMRQTIEYRDRIFELEGFGLRQLALWYGPIRQRWFSAWNDGPLRDWIAEQDPASIDLRTIDNLLREAGAMPDLMALECLQPGWRGSPHDLLPPENIWPLFHEQPALIEQGLGLSVARSDVTLELAWTLKVIELFPQPPVRWRPRLMELALGEGKTYRQGAQDVLRKVPDIGLQVIASLASSKQEVRSVAARWLADLDCRAAVPALYQALDKESRETVSATLMAALETLGADLAPRLHPDKLLAEALKGLKARAPAGLDWFPFETLPACTWHDGAPVEPDIIRWWVVLACKLKEPGGNGLLARYLGLLSPAGRAALGEQVLRAFIAYDESRGSVIGEKGILALAAHAPGPVAVSLLQAYMRAFHVRRAQIEAMLEGLAVGMDPAVIQLLLGVSRRYRTASVQDKARELVEQIAERRGWSEDQLADRTVPTGGLDDDGRLELDYGGRQFVVTLDAALKPVLRNADGKEVKALPEPRHGDDADSIKEAKQALTSCKKELKQVLDMQTARLYDAMCTDRSWPVDEWQAYLAGHPIVARLVQRLLWLAQDAEGALQVVRPTEDGSLIDLDDQEVALAPASTLRLAHASLLDAGDAAAWQRHLKDYKVKPLFEQLQRASPAADLLTGIDIGERVGWVSDAYTLRGAFGKLGYQRAQAEDGGIFDHYFKEFSGAGMRVVIHFSGNALPEDNLPAAVKELSFERLSGPWKQRAVSPAQVPPVLLAEAYNDYLAVAAHGAYDADWEAKMPW